MKKNKPTKVGAGRPRKWKGRQTKVIRIPVEFVAKIVELIDYMDANRGELPENFPKYIRDPGELPYRRASFYSDKDDFEDDFEDDSIKLPLMLSHHLLRQMTSEEMEATAEWRKNYLNDLIAKSAQT